MSKNWKYFIPGYIMAAPLTLFGLLMALYYRPQSIYFVDGCIEFVMPSRRHLIGGEWVGGQTFGNVIFYRDERTRQHIDLRVHERCHTVQAMVGGIFFAAAYGIHFLMNYRTLPFYEAYQAIWAEEQARAKQDNPNGWGA